MERGEVFLRVPSEIAIGGVYMPPLLVATVIGALLAIVTAKVLNRTRLSRYFFFPPLVFVAMVVIYTVAIGTFLLPI